MKNRVRRVKSPQRSSNAWFRLILVIGMFFGGSSVDQAQVAMRFFDSNWFAKSVKHFGDETWLATNRGAYRIKGDSAPQRILDQDLEVDSISRFGDETWLATKQGAYRIKGDSAPQRIPDQDLEVDSISRFGDETWLATKHGAYRIKGDSAPQRIPGQDQEVYWVDRFGDETWLGTFTGAYRIKANSAPQRIPDQDVFVWRIYHFGDDRWVATTHGAYRIKGDSAAQRIPDQDISVWQIYHFGDETWLATSGGAYRIKGDSAPQRIPDQDQPVHSISRFGDETWLATNHGAYRIKGDSAPQRIPDQDLEAGSISRFGNETWMITNDGVYRIKGNSTPERIPDQDLEVYSISRFGDETWLATKHGAYRIKGDSAPQRIPDQDLEVDSIYRFGNEMWLATLNGTYRIDYNVNIIPVAVSADSWWKKCLGLILPGNIWLAGQITPSAHYQRLSDHRDPYPKDVPREFEFIMEPTEKQFEARQGRFLDAQHAIRNVSIGRQTLFLSARDQWRNTFKSDPFPISAWVVPGAGVVPIILGAFWLGLLFLVLALAPFSTFCHDLLMNPFVRKYGSFGFVPLVMTVLPPVRRHLLRRYFAGIRRDENFMRLQQSYVVPTADFLDETFGVRLKNQSPVLLIGQSGIGKTAFFRYLTSSYASKPPQAIDPHGAVPIFVPLARYQEVDPEEMLNAQLVSYGRFTDRKLNHWFLEHGGFLFLLDGLNEVSDRTRALINSFVDQYKNSSYFGISSQQKYKEYSTWMQPVQLASLSPEKIKALLTQQLGDARALEVIKQFTPKTYELYAIPQDLRLAIELLDADKTLPQSRQELYAMSLTPIFQDWTDAGQGDFPIILMNRAYKMLCDHDPFFDQPQQPLPVDLTDRLLEQKILVKRSERLLFQHDLIRAYLASLYLVQEWNCLSVAAGSSLGVEWNSLLSDPTVKIDANWRAMLEFTILEVSNAEATKELLLVILNKNRQVAGELYKWVKDSHPEFVAGWAEDFTRAYGEASLE